MSEKEGSSSHAAVDLNQFRNTVVGEGYQAKHVVRQRAASYANPNIKIIDRTKPVSKQEVDQKDKSKKRKQSKTNKMDKKLAKYLQNAGLRQFRKELESIVQSS